MAKSPSKALSKIQATSGRLTARARRTRESLKFTRFQLPVSLAREVPGRANAAWKQMKFPCTRESSGKKCPKIEVSRLEKCVKPRLVRPLLRKKILRKFAHSNLRFADANCELASEKEEFPRKNKIGIFERLRKTFPENRRSPKSGEFSRRENSIKSNGKHFKAAEERINKNKYAERDVCGIKMESARKQTPEAKAKQSAQLNYEIPSANSREKGNSALKKAEATRRLEQLRKTSLETRGVLAPAPEILKRNGNARFPKKEADNMTVNTCNTMQEITPFQVEGALAKQKRRLVRLSKMQKHFLAYEGNFRLKFQEIAELIISAEEKESSEADFVFGSALDFKAPALENGRLDCGSAFAVQAEKRNHFPRSASFGPISEMRKDAAGREGPALAGRGLHVCGQQALRSASFENRARGQRHWEEEVPEGTHIKAREVSYARRGL